MNSKLAAVLLPLPIVGAVVIPFASSGDHSRALHDGLMMAIATCAFLMLGLALARAVTRGISRRQLEPMLLMALGFLVNAYALGAAPAGQFALPWIGTVGILVVLAGILLHLRSTVQAKQGKTGVESDPAL